MVSCIIRDNFIQSHRKLCVFVRSEGGNFPRARALKRAGLIERIPGVPRNIKLLTPPEGIVTSSPGRKVR